MAGLYTVHCPNCGDLVDLSTETGVGGGYPPACVEDDCPYVRLALARKSRKPHNTDDVDTIPAGKLPK